ncbi:MAG: hypothetical protein QOD51_1269 [Candidatus Eremiobacteraeota bacterium]|nr:hypothetical protein [Candidatus Eremiobacteraeota bacterium]
MNVAVAVGSARIPLWQAWCIAALRRQSVLQVRVVGVAAPQRARPPRIAGNALAPVDVALDDGDVTGADLVVDLSGAAVAADAPHGVWRLRLGEDDDAALPFAREIAAGGSTFRTALVRRRGGHDEVLRAGRFAVSRWYPSTLRTALRETARWPATLAAALAAGSNLPALADDAVPPNAARANAAPLGPLSRMRFTASLGRRLAAGVLTALLEVDEWNVGLVRGDAAQLLSSEPLDVRWLPDPPSLTYIADPFLVERGGVRALFVETFDYRDERGAIEALVLDENDDIVRRARVIDIATHLSYPYPLEIDGQLYLVPENCAGGEVALYRCTSFPDRWEREAALFPAFDGVDTTLFPHDGRWWAFCTRYSRGSTLALNAFFAGSPRGPWSPHALNPIVVDVASARPGGQPFIVDGALYRPAQDCSQSYGGGLVIARIDELTPTAYREEIVQRHDARALGRWNGGIHTVSFARDRIVIDGKRVYRDVRKLRGVTKRVAGLARRLLRPRPANEATFA